MTSEEFARCMNPPEPPVTVGGVYYDNVDMCENPYTVLRVEVVNGKFYAVCRHVDEFSGEDCEVRVYAYNLSETLE